MNLNLKFIEVCNLVIICDENMNNIEFYILSDQVMKCALNKTPILYSYLSFSYYDLQKCAEVLNVAKFGEPWFRTSRQI